MGNKLGGPKSPKPKDERKRDKELTAKLEKQEEKAKKKTTKKEKKENKRKIKEKANKADTKSKHKSGRQGDHNSGSEFDTDLESSHVTGGDSGSVVFHSAENISSSPYLDSHTRSELEHSETWSALYESPTSRHPQVLSSRDFRDGFSLEACIPPEIARRDTSYYDHDGGSGGGLSGCHTFSYSNSSSLKSKRSNSTKSSHATPSTSRQHHDDLMSVSTTSSQKSGVIGREGYSTPLLNTPVFGRVDRSHSPCGPYGPYGVSTTLSRVREADRNSMDISPYDPNAKIYTSYNPPAHLAHLYKQSNEAIDYRTLPKPTSPHPQRRALSPKMTSLSFKLISSDDSSSSPSTPVPQRKTGNILTDLLRPQKGNSDKKKRQKCANTSGSDENGTTTPVRKSLAEEEEKKKSRGLSMWKTWERSSKKKKEKQGKTSIFGTSRKSSKRSDASLRKEDNMLQSDKSAERNSDSTLKGLTVFCTNGYTSNDKTTKSKNTNSQRPSKAAKSSTSSYENSTSRCASDTDFWGDKNRNSSPPVAKSAAFCIMRLEELERNIERTIREKFPDAESFLLRKRTPPDDSSRGSKSLPTTPSPKKKMFVTHDNSQSSQKEAITSITSTLAAASSKLGTVVGATRYYNETFEESASPVMSPVVLRRFGVRTRHASISPKIQHAKTAALYNSPSEMERVAECVTPENLESSSPSESTSQRQESTATNETSRSHSFQHHGHHLVRQRRIEQSGSEEDTPGNPCTQYRGAYNQNERTDRTEEVSVKGKGGVGTDSFDKPVIVPSFSAIFGSVSPKLKRHLQTKFDVKKEKESRSFHQSHSDASQYHKSEASAGRLTSHEHRSESVDNALKASRNEQRRRFILGEPSNSGFDDWASRKRVQKQKQHLAECHDSTSSPIVKSRVEDIMKTMSEGCTGVGEGSGGYPSQPLSHNSDQFTSTHAAPASPTRGWANSNFYLRSADTKHTGGVNTETKESHMTSPGSRRKHSTDHVIFGPAVALPCRLYSNTSSPPSSPERRRGTTNDRCPESHIDSTPFALAPDGAKRVHGRNVKEGQVDENINTPSTQSQHSQSVCKESRTYSECRVEESRHGVVGKSASLSVHKDDASKGDAFATKTRASGKGGVNIKQSGVTSGSYSGDCSDSLLDIASKDRTTQSLSPSGTQVGQLKETLLEDEQRALVLKQPVSKVISDMINNSRHRPQQQQQKEPSPPLQSPKQQQQQRLQQQQQRHTKQHQEHETNWQSNPTTPEKDAIYVETAVTMLTASSFGEECLSLEEKRVFNESSHPLSSSIPASRRDEKDKHAEELCRPDELTKHSSGQGMECAQSSDKDNVLGAAANRATSSEIEDSDLEQFLDSVKSSEKLPSRSKTMEQVVCESSSENKEQNPPPPRSSPTAAAKVSEILEEEVEEDEQEEDNMMQTIHDDNCSRKEVELALVRHSEMRAFSDEVCQRLSDLLSSHAGSDDVFVEVDGKGGEDDNDDDDDERAIDDEKCFIENAAETMPEEDLKEQWINSCLGTKPSENHPLIMEAPAISANELTPASELLRRHRFSTSSSLSTSTSSSSSSGLFAPPSLPPSGKRNHEDTPKRAFEQEEYFTYRKQNDEDDDDDAYFDDGNRSRREELARCCHSDDDIARGGGIPDYYDDRPLWRRRQKPPGQLSVALAATRRRERRERWLKKRRRNKTDLLSTGSSDMGSQTSLRLGSRLSFGDSTGSCEYDEDDEVAKALSSHRRAMGSGILASPKYSKPIMPFMGSCEIQQQPSPKTVAEEEIITPEKVEQRLTASLHRSIHDDFDAIKTHHSGDRDSSTLSRSSDRTIHDEHSQSLDTTGEFDDHWNSMTSSSSVTTTTMPTTTAVGSHSHIIIPGLEETFDELMSVKQILEELQDRNPHTASGVQNPQPESNNGKKFMPLTAENVRSIREHYKDSSGNGRRSRLSNTDRTESDLDLFSEYRDDASTDSNLYADDEDDDDTNDPYATADDEVGGATGGDEMEDFVVSCTFYNSNSAPPDYVNANKCDRSLEGRVESKTSFSRDVSFKGSELPSMAFYKTNTGSNMNENNGKTHNNNNDNNNNGGESFRDLLARPAGTVYGRSHSAPGTRSAAESQLSLARDASAAGYNSDEEFWAGRAAFERSYQQLESAAGAVSSTFQNAREQMMDIQQHLQALRRQMEGLQDDLTSTTYTLTPDFSAFDSK